MLVFKATVFVFQSSQRALMTRVTLAGCTQKAGLQEYKLLQVMHIVLEIGFMKQGGLYDHTICLPASASVSPIHTPQCIRKAPSSFKKNMS